MSMKTESSARFKRSVSGGEGKGRRRDKSSSGYSGGLTMEAVSPELVHILIPHPHDYREWEIIGPDPVRGFWRLESRLRLDKDGTTIFCLVLHETQFERL
jgi:hypothetical protein